MLHGSVQIQTPDASYQMPPPVTHDTLHYRLFAAWDHVHWAWSWLYPLSVLVSLQHWLCHIQIWHRGHMISCLAPSPLPKKMACCSELLKPLLKVYLLVISTVHGNQNASPFLVFLQIPQKVPLDFSGFCALKVAPLSTVRLPVDTIILQSWQGDWTDCWRSFRGMSGYTLYMSLSSNSWHTALQADCSARPQAFSFRLVLFSFCLGTPKTWVIWHSDLAQWPYDWTAESAVDVASTYDQDSTAAQNTLLTFVIPTRPTDSSPYVRWHWSSIAFFIVWDLSSWWHHSLAHLARGLDRLLAKLQRFKLCIYPNCCTFQWLMTPSTACCLQRETMCAKIKTNCTLLILWYSQDIDCLTSRSGTRAIWLHLCSPLWWAHPNRVRFEAGAGSEPRGKWLETKLYQNKKMRSYTTRLFLQVGHCGFVLD